MAKICPCGAKAVPGLIPSVALCQKHYNDLMFGTGPDHRHAVALLRQSQGASVKPQLTRTT